MFGDGDDPAVVNLMGQNRQTAMRRWKHHDVTPTSAPYLVTALQVHDQQLASTT